MKVFVVDCRKDRAELVVKHCEGAGYSAEYVLLGTTKTTLPDVDLVLLHVGEQQAIDGDDVRRLLTHYGQSTWTLCYSGGTALRLAKDCTEPFVALFPHPVTTRRDGPFLAIVSRALQDAPRRDMWAKDYFRTLVLGVDELLEAKLDFLAARLAGKEPKPKSRDTLNSRCPAIDLSEVDALDGSYAALTSLRNALFNR